MPQLPANGLPLRADLHTLIDRGLMTVMPENVIEVSDQIKEAYGNGRRYYALHGQKLRVLPEAPRGPRPNAWTGTIITCSGHKRGSEHVMVVNLLSESLLDLWMASFTLFFAQADVAPSFRPFKAGRTGRATPSLCNWRLPGGNPQRYCEEAKQSMFERDA